VYTSAGNLVAFAIGLGAPVVVLVAGAVVRRPWRAGSARDASRSDASRSDAPRRDHSHPDPSRIDGLLAGLLVTLLGMALSHVYLLEVERIWLFLIGPCVAVAAAELARRRPPARTVQVLVGLLLAQSLLMETLLYTFW
jgi:hypothetical protein